MKGKITISRPSYGCGKEKININILDCLSRQRFLTVEIDYGVFAQALTGLSELSCDINVRNLSRVGMKKETKDFELLMPKGSFNDKDIAKKLALENEPEGWEVSLYFDSQNSFFDRNGERWARTTVSRWTDVD